MHKSLESICVSLEELSKAMISGWSGDQTFNEAFGWNCPALTRHDMAALTIRLSERIKDRKVEEIESSLLSQVKKPHADILHKL